MQNFDHYAEQVCRNLNDIRESLSGASLRDQFAIAALQGDWAAQSRDLGHIFSSATPEEAMLTSASLYYRMADAMMKAREETHAADLQS